MKLNNLKNIDFNCSYAECHRQSWQNNSKWTYFEKHPRPYDGFILICSDMTMTFTSMNGKVIKATKGDVVFVPKNTLYSVFFANTTNDTDSFTVSFSLKNENGEEIVFEDEMQKLECKFTSACYFAVNELFKSYLNYSVKPIIYKAKVYEFLDCVLDLTSHFYHFYYPIKKGVELLEKEWNLNFPIEKYATVCNMKKSYFYKLFKTWCNLSPNQYRNTLRLSHAKSMLTNTNLSISQIAEKTGFDDPYYFSRLFKKEIGLSPQNYKKINLTTL